MDQYDPMLPPDPAAWLAVEQEHRIELVQAYHAAQAIDLPNARLHAVAHAMVEDQIVDAESQPVREKLRQLMAQGLDRHEAVHAIGSVLMSHLHAIAAGRITGADSNRRYDSALRRLHPRPWLRAAGR